MRRQRKDDNKQHYFTSLHEFKEWISISRRIIMRPYECEKMLPLKTSKRPSKNWQSSITQINEETKKSSRKLMKLTRHFETKRKKANTML
jgi:hypothetical protein